MLVSSTARQNSEPQTARERLSYRTETLDRVSALYESGREEERERKRDKKRVCERESERERQRPCGRLSEALRERFVTFDVGLYRDDGRCATIYSNTLRQGPRLHGGDEEPAQEIETRSVTAIEKESTRKPGGPASCLIM